MDRPVRLAWWGTLAGLIALVIGLAFFFFYALSEVLANPELSLVDAYWIGRLPWTGYGEGFTVVGATGAVVLGAVTVWRSGVLWRQLVVMVPLVAAALFWFVAMLPSPFGGLCNDCPPPTPDPFAYAYSVPENTVIFLILPALVASALALTTPRGSVHSGSLAAARDPGSPTVPR